MHFCSFICNLFDRNCSTQSTKWPLIHAGLLIVFRSQVASRVAPLALDRQYSETDDTDESVDIRTGNDFTAIECTEQNNPVQPETRREVGVQCPEADITPAESGIVRQPEEEERSNFVTGLLQTIRAERTQFRAEIAEIIEQRDGFEFEALYQHQENDALRAAIKSKTNEISQLKKRNKELESKQYMLDFRQLLGGSLELKKLNHQQKCFYFDVVIKKRNAIAHSEDLAYIRSQDGYDTMIQTLEETCLLTQSEATIVYQLFPLLRPAKKSKK